MSHLQALDSCRPDPLDQYQVVPLLSHVCTPLIYDKWVQELVGHPDREFATFITEGIRSGFRIGFNRQGPELKHSQSNKAISNPSVVQEYLDRELALGRMVKFHSLNHLPSCQISPIGIIPKKNKPNKWRLIVDLSSPKNYSVNDGIAEEWSTLSYTSVDHLASLVLNEGKGSFLVKADISEAYRIIPVHPQDRWLLGVCWEESVYIDTVLPFGLRSAPKIFSAVADAAQWVLVNKGIPKVLHYLDDYALVAKDKREAEQRKHILTSTFGALGIPLEPSKMEGPETCLTFLGIEVDTLALQLRLPEAKLSRLIAELEVTLKLKAITKRKLQSIVGLLQHAAKVVKPGRSFVRRLYALLTQVGPGHTQNHLLRLNTAARADLLWWHTFVTRWNGTSMLWHVNVESPDVIVFSDASGGVGVWSPLASKMALSRMDPLSTNGIHCSEGINSGCSGSSCLREILGQEGGTIPGR